MKVVLNGCFGGFGLTDSALAALGVDYAFDVDRTDPRLVAMVEGGGKVSSSHADLYVVDVPDGVQWSIREYDGMESIVVDASTKSMNTEALIPIEPGNPFLSDLFNMGTQIGTNCTVMYGKHTNERCAYLIVVNTETGERIRVTFNK